MSLKRALNVATESPLPICNLEADVVNVAFVTEIPETPSTKSSNLFVVLFVTVYASEILYQTPVDSVGPSVPLCAVVVCQSCSTPALVSLMWLAWAFPLVIPPIIVVVALGSVSIYT
jgi:hypothetical protein